MTNAYGDETLSRADRGLIALAREVRLGGYDFTTVTPATHRRVNARPENGLAQSLTDVFGWSRPFDPSILPPGLFDRMLAAEIAVPDRDLYRSAVRLSSLDGEVFVHSAYPTTGADAVFFGPDTYRFAAAISAFLALRHRLPARAVDIGTGAGPGGILIAKRAPDAEVWLGDINEAALRLARVNAALAGIGNTTVMHSDILAGVPGTFDLIVANPPYLVDAKARAYRHGGGDFGAGLSLKILDQSIERLSLGGTLLLYTGSAIVGGVDLFRRDASARLAPSGLAFDYRELDPDVFGEELEAGPYTRADRIAAILLTATRKD